MKRKEIQKSVAVALLMCGFAAGTQAFGASAEVDTLAKVRHNGLIVMGVRDDSLPLSYSVGDRFVGYHVELCQRVLHELLPKAEIRYMVVTAQNRAPLLENGTIDIDCGSTTNNLMRQVQTTFAVTTYVTEVLIAVRADSSIRSEADLKDKTIATLVGSTHVPKLRKLDKDLGLNLKISLSKDHVNNFLELTSGRADAVSMDNNVLAGSIALSRTPEAFRIIGKPLSVNPLAIGVHKDDMAFKKAIDASIVAKMQSGELAALYDKWFLKPIPPRDAVIGLPMSASLKAAFAAPNNDPSEAYEAKP